MLKITDYLVPKVLNSLSDRCLIHMHNLGMTIVILILLFFVCMMSVIT